MVPLLIADYYTKSVAKFWLFMRYFVGLSLENPTCAGKSLCKSFLFSSLIAACLQI